jgi:hypothetical protein
MKRVTTREGGGADSACRYLAVRVIEQAVRDLSGAGASPADRESARGFLSGSPMLHRWCELANLDASWMVGRAAQLVARSGPFSIDTAIPDDGPVKRACAPERRTERGRSAEDFGRFNDGSAATERLSPRAETADSSRVRIVRTKT